MSFSARLAEYRATLGDDDFIPSLVAHDFIDLMAREYPKEYSEWLRTHAIRWATEELADQLRSERARAHRRAGARAFWDAAHGGDVSVFACVFEVASDHTRRRVGAMTGADHLYVSGRYEKTGNRALLLAECHRLVAQKIGDRRTDEVLSENEYLAVFENATDAQAQVSA